MRRPESFRLLFLFICSIVITACSGNTDNSATTVTTTVTPPPVQTLAVISRPPAILDLMKGRGEQDEAAPTLKIVAPAADAVITGSKVEVKLAISGDLKGYMPHKDPATGKGNHIHVILDNEPYEAYYELGQPFELRNVAEGKHTLRVFASRPWHESYKNEGSFQMVTFTVKGGGDASKPTTTASGQTMANAGQPAASPSGSPVAGTREGKDVAPSKAGDIDPTKPLLTYSRPKGEYKGEDGNAIMIDFWLSNAKLKGDGGEYRIRYFVNDDEARYIDKWDPVWLGGWLGGQHSVRLELLDKEGRPVENGGYNTTTRTITVVK